MRDIALVALATLTASLLVLSSCAVAPFSVNGFEYDEGTGEVVGTFISFSFDPWTGTVADYTLSGGQPTDGTLTVFTSITIENFASEVPPLTGTLFPRVEGVFTAVGDYASIRAVDSPGGSLAIANLGLLATGTGFVGDIGTVDDVEIDLPYLDAWNNVTYTLAPGLEATVEMVPGSLDISFVNITGDDFWGLIFASGHDISVEGSDVIVRLHGPEATFFHGLPLTALEVTERHLELDLLRNAAEGHIGARIDLQMLGPGQVNMVKTAYRKSFHARIVSALHNRVVLELESNQTQGTIVALDIGQDLMDLGKDVRVLLDGEVVTEATSLDALVDLESEGSGDPLAYVVSTQAGVSVAVYVPHFSTRILTVETVGEAPGGGALGNPTVMALVAVAAVVVIAAAVAALRRRE